MSDMVRMSIDVPADLHKHAKMAAAYNDQTIREFVIEQIRKALARKPAKPKGKRLNRLTRETIEKEMRGEDVFEYASFDDFLHEMGED